MDIYILRAGEETGPFSIETARTLLEQGDVTEGDFAWRPGMEKWIPLKEVLETSPAQAPSPSPETPAGKSEPATAKQKAFLSYFGIPVPAELSKDQAAMLVNDAMEDPGNTERLAHWNEERMRLHPELFAADIQARKENRANRFFEICQSAGAEYFSGITKAHCQVLVGFLDVKFPHWDAREAEAAEHYFFPAVAEKFPQLVHKEWRGRLHYPEAMKVAPEIVRSSSTSKLRRTATSPLVAISRGVVLGFVILGGLYLAHRTMQSGTVAAPIVEKSAALEAPTTIPATPAPETAPPSPAPAPPVNSPPVEPVQPVAQADPTPAPPTVPVTPPAATPEPATNTAPMASIPAPPEPAMAPAPMAPTPMAPTAQPGMAPSALDTAPMAALPGTEPPVPVAPPPATMPAPTVLPSLPPEAAAVPPLTMPPDNLVAPPTATAVKTNILLTKPVDVQLAYGKITLPAGTPVKLISRQGAVLRVSHGSSVITVPAGSTNID